MARMARPGPHGLLQAGCEHVSPAAAGKMPVACLAPHSCAPTGSEKTSRGSVASAAECLLEFWWYGRSEVLFGEKVWQALIEMGLFCFVVLLLCLFPSMGSTVGGKSLSLKWVSWSSKVPHFPDDSEDPFWSSLDLFAAASCAASISDSQNAFLLLELHLQRSKPDLAFAGLDCRHLSTICLLQRCWPYVRTSMPILLVYSPLLTPHWFWLFHMMQGYARQKCFMMFPSPDPVWSFTLHTPKPYQWPRWTSMNLRESMAGSLGKR